MTFTAVRLISSGKISLIVNIMFYQSFLYRLRGMRTLFSEMNRFDKLDLMFSSALKMKESTISPPARLARLLLLLLFLIATLFDPYRMLVVIPSPSGKARVCERERYSERESHL